MAAMQQSRMMIALRSSTVGCSQNWDQTRKEKILLFNIHTARDLLYKTVPDELR
jgi:hypothetical protein